MTWKRARDLAMIFGVFLFIAAILAGVGK